MTTIIALPCAKCGGEKIRVRYHDNAGRDCGYSRCDGIDFAGGSHLSYVCQRCLYRWGGPTKDQK